MSRSGARPEKSSGRERERKGEKGMARRRRGRGKERDRNEEELTRWPRGGVHCERDGVLGTEYRESSSQLLGGRWRNELGEEVKRGDKKQKFFPLNFPRN